MTNSNKMRVWILCLVMLFVLSTTVVFARGSFGGGGFSGGRSFSGGFSSGRSFSGGFSSSRSSGFSSHSSGFSRTSSGGGFSRPSRATSSGGSFSRSTRVTSFTRPDGTRVNSAKMSAADRAMISKATTNHTMFSSRSQAQTAFKQKYASQYTNKFSAEPKVRPNYIPSRYSVGGRNYNIVFHNGSYGYYDSMHRWMIYDMFSDAIMMNTMMNHHNYMVCHSYTQPIHHHGFPWVWIIVILIVIIFLAFIIKNNN